MSQNELILENIGSGQYRFRYPRFVNDLDDLVFDAIDLIESGEFVEAKNILHTVIDEFPEHLDAYHYLAICLHQQNEGKIAFATWQKAIAIGISLLPAGVEIGDIQLEWGWLENRPFLRAYFAMGLRLYERDKLHEALTIFDNILNIDPLDSQGARVIAIKINFELKRPRAILKICNRYPEDGLAETFYGRLLASIQLKKSQRKQILHEAIDFLPMIAIELVKPNHSEFDALLLSGGFDEEEIEAVEYWQNFGKYWQETKGAIEFVKQGLSGSAGADSY